jgi:Na+-translocating ferredoxin:NAD+ oxidoreductase RnfG subunit
MKSRVFKTIVLLTIFLCVGKLSYAKKFPRPVQKKIEETVSETFGGQNYKFKIVENSNFKYDNVEGIEFEKIFSGSKKVGYVGFASSFSKDDYFDYMVIFDNDLFIEKVVVLIYRSGYGSQITDEKWLQQFIGKKNGENMIMNQDIDAVTGASVSSPALALGVKALSKFVYRVK